jgi:hypothetical protein
MIVDNKDFQEQLNNLKEGINIPQLDPSKIMDSDEFNTFLNGVEIALNDLTQNIRVLEDANEYLINYINDIVDKKYKDINDKLLNLEKNYSLYQDKNFITYNVELDNSKKITDRTGNAVNSIDYTTMQSGIIDLFKNVSTTEAYSVDIDKEHGSAVICFSKNAITQNNSKIGTFIIKLLEPITLNVVSCNLVNCTGTFTINNSIQEYRFNKYFKPQEVSLIVITLKSGDPIIESKIVKANSSKGFMDNDFYGDFSIIKNSEKAKEQQMAEIYYKNDVTKYLGENDG